MNNVNTSQKNQLHWNTEPNCKTEGAMEGVGVAVLHQLSPEGLWSRPKTKGVPRRTCSAGSGQEGQEERVTTGNADRHEFLGFWPHAPALIKLISPLVEESWEVTGLLPSSSGSIFLASCFPSSTLPGRGEWYEQASGTARQIYPPTCRPFPPSPWVSNSPPLVKAVDVPDDALDEDLVLVHGCRGHRLGL